jgi:peptide/nickel transport system permease protein
MSLLKYAIRRILAMVPVVFGVVTMTFIFSRMMPGDPVLAYYMSRSGTTQIINPELLRAMRHQLGFDLPIIVQYFRFIGELFTGNWGSSVAIAQEVEVWDLISDRLPITIDLTIYTMIIASYVGIKIGVISAVHRNKAKDTVFRGLALIGVAIPVFFMGMILQYFLCIQPFNVSLFLGTVLVIGIAIIASMLIRNYMGKVKINKKILIIGAFLIGIGAIVFILPYPYETDALFSATGYKNPSYADPDYVTGFYVIDAFLSGEIYKIWDYFHHLILPVFVLSFVSIASIIRQTRSSMLEVLEQDYIRTARAKGVKEKVVVHKHALRNSLIPTVTLLGFGVAGLLAGAILTETTFNLNGIGRLYIDAINQTDYWVLTAVVFVITLIFVSTTLITDLLYAVLDPRIRY